MMISAEFKKEEDSKVLDRALAQLAADPRLRPGARIMVAMSGGVDSSVVAALLQHAGFEVLGVSMHLLDKGQALDEPGKIRPRRSDTPCSHGPTSRIAAAPLLTTNGGSPHKDTHDPLTYQRPSPGPLCFPLRAPRSGPWSLASGLFASP